MKRILMAGAMVLLLASLSGCVLILGAWNKTVTYLVDLNGSSAVVTITYTNSNGNLTQITGWTGNFSTSFDVSGDRNSSFLAFVQAEVTAAPLASTYLQVAIDVDGTQKAYGEDDQQFAQATASYLVD